LLRDLNGSTAGDPNSGPVKQSALSRERNKDDISDVAEPALPCAILTEFVLNPLCAANFKDGLMGNSWRSRRSRRIWAQWHCRQQWATDQALVT